MSQSSILPRPCSTAGRKAAGRIANTTRRSAAVWIAEAQGVERRRRETVQHIAELVGIEPVRWDGEISTDDFERVLSAGADAILALRMNTDNAYALDLVDAAERYAVDAARLGIGTTVDRTDIVVTPGRRTEHLVDELLTTQEPDLTDDVRTPAVEAAIATWSPFSTTRCAAARYVVRCADGSRRYGNSELAEVA